MSPARLPVPDGLRCRLVNLVKYSIDLTDNASRSDKNVDKAATRSS